jgi:hypothetical protein
MSSCLRAVYYSKGTCAPSYETRCHYCASFCEQLGWTLSNNAGDKYHTQRASHLCAHGCDFHISLQKESKIKFCTLMTLLVKFDSGIKSHDLANLMYISNSQRTRKTFT